MTPQDDRLLVVMNGVVVGDIVGQGNSGGRLLYSSAAATPLSMSMPLAKARHRARVLLPWLRNLLPDRESVLLQWRRTFGVRSRSPIELLRHVGEEVAGGAQFVRPERLAEATAWKPARPLREQEVGDMLRRAIAEIPEADLASSTGRFSLAGMQPKIALRRQDDGRWALPQGVNPTTHIVKPALSGLQDQHVNEYLTMTAARLVGLAAATTEVDVIDSIPVVIVERYDRYRVDGRWRRAHQEDLLQALGFPPETKYQNQGGPGVRVIAEVLRQVTRGEDSLRDFLSSHVFHWLTVSTDAHAKNYSLLLAGDAARLAPLYDLSSYLFYGQGAPRDLSMSIGAEYQTDRIAWSDWASLARDCTIDEAWVAQEIRRQASILPDAFSDAAKQLNRSVLTGSTPGSSDLPGRLAGYVEQWSQAALAQVGLD